MKWTFGKALLSLSVAFTILPCFAYDVQIIHGLKRAKYYKSASKHVFYIQTKRFSQKAKASHYQRQLQAKTSYPVVLSRKRHAYVVMIGPINSAEEVRRTAIKITNSPKMAALSANHHLASRKQQPRQVHHQYVVKKAALPSKQKLAVSQSGPVRHVMNPDQALPVTKKTALPPHQLMDDNDLNSIAAVSAHKPEKASFFSQFAGARHGLFVSVGTGMQYPQFNSSTTVNNGSGFPAPFDKDLYSFKNDSHPVFTLAGGYRFERDEQWFPAYSVGGFYEYLFSNNVGGTIMQFSTPSFTNYTYSWDISAQVLLASAKVDLFSYEHIMPYVSGGIGGVSLRASGYSETALAGVTPRVSAGYEDKTTVRLAYSLGLGLDYQINRQWLVSAGYEYLSLGDVTSGVGSGGWAGKSLSLGSYHANEALISATYLFDNHH